MVKKEASGSQSHNNHDNLDLFDIIKTGEQVLHAGKARVLDNLAPECSKVLDRGLREELTSQLKSILKDLEQETDKNQR